MPGRLKVCTPMRLPRRSRFAAFGFWRVERSEVVSGYLREGLDDGAVFVGAVGEVEVAENFGAADGATDCIGCGNLLDTGRGDGYAEACAD
jgi:hypothetical protein